MPSEPRKANTKTKQNEQLLRFPSLVGWRLRLAAGRGGLAPRAGDTSTAHAASAPRARTGRAADDAAPAPGLVLALRQGRRGSRYDLSPLSRRPRSGSSRSTPDT